MQALLASADEPLTRRNILRAWPDTAPAPARHTLWKWLTRAVQEGHVIQHGNGTRKDPYHYFLPGMTEKWHTKLLADFARRLERQAGATLPR